MYTQNIEKDITHEIEETEEIKEAQVHEIENSYNPTEEESAQLDVTDDTQRYITVSLKDALESYDTDIPVMPDETNFIMEEVTEPQTNDNDNNLSDVQVTEPDEHKKESSKKRSLLNTLLSIFRPD